MNKQSDKRSGHPLKGIRQFAMLSVITLTWVCWLFFLLATLAGVWWSLTVFFAYPLKEWNLDMLVYGTLYVAAMLAAYTLAFPWTVTKHLLQSPSLPDNESSIDDVIQHVELNP